MSIIQGNAHTSAGGGGFQIERSLRFNSADSAYLNRTPASDGNRRTWTLSTWVKISAFGSQVFILGAGADGDNRTDVRIDSDSLQFVNIVANTTNANLKTTQVFRDPSAWYHIVIAVDSTQATSTNRIKVYVNGSEVTAFSTSTYFSQNTDTFVNDNSGHTIGRYSISGSNYFNGYMADFHLVDGQALTPSSFGETDSATGVWKPKAFSGTYGTNGFYLKFADNSGTTSTTLGKDSSGNGNNWTPNNFSVTAGAGNDSMVDSPTAYGTDTGVGGEVRGNYATLNPLHISTSTNATYTEGNLRNSKGMSLSTIAMTTGKYVFEWVYLAGSQMCGVGWSDASCGVGTGNYVVYRSSSGNKEINGTGSSYGATWTTNDVIRVEYNVDTGVVEFFKNNTSQGTISTSLTGNPVFFIGYTDNVSGAATANFGQRPFANTATSGFKALCTQNLPTPTIGATSTTQANDYFNVLLYTGNSTTPNATRAITGVGFQPDFVWIKNRSAAPSHLLQNAVVGANKLLFSDGNSSEQTDWAYGHLNSFDSDGFTVDSGSDSSVNTAISINRNNDNYVSWNWKANGAGSSNTAGTITSTVSANTTSGFSIVTYTGTGANATVGHGLGVAPSMIIAKLRSSTSNWPVYHRSLDAGKVVWLDLTDGQTTSVSYNGAPTSSIINLGTAGGTNTSSGTHVIYAFAPVAGYSAFGSFTGNGSTDGPFVFTNFRPRYVLIKLSSNAGEGWVLNDTSRSPYNVCAAQLQANSSGAEVSGDANTYIDILSNGFKIRTTAGTHNTSGYTYIYACFAENPFKYSLAR